MPNRDLGNVNQQVIAEFRTTGGTVGGYVAGMTLLLLTTVGAKSGRRQTVPLTYLADGERHVVVAAAGGTAANPAWYHNLITNPTVTVEVGTDVFDATARIATGDEREALFSRFVAQYPQLALYQARTTRQIPVIILTRRETAW